MWNKQKLHAKVPGNCSQKGLKICSSYTAEGKTSDFKLPPKKIKKERERERPSG